MSLSVGFPVGVKPCKPISKSQVVAVPFSCQSKVAPIAVIIEAVWLEG